MKHHGPTMVDNGDCFGIGVYCFGYSKTAILVNIRCKAK